MPAFDETDPFGAPPRAKPTHVVGEIIDTLSVDEIDARIVLLAEEIERLERARLARIASKAAADGFFKV